MKLAWLARIMMSHGLWLIWSCLALILFLSGEGIFILPLLFIAVALYELMSFCLGRITLWGMLRAFVWCACLAIFSYLSAENSQAKLFFPLLCVSSAFYMLLQPFKRPQIYSLLLVPTWLICIALVFYFGFWPIGLVTMSIGWSFSVALFIKQKKEPRPDQKNQEPAQEAPRQGDQAPLPWPAFQIPGQQYQSLLPEHDRSFGPYIQDLPPVDDMECMSLDLKIL